jgi:hypothetical protein
MKKQIESKGIVKEMRNIREKLSSDISTMSLEQEKSFIRSQLNLLKSKI